MAAPRRTSQRITLLMLVLASITVLTLDYHGSVQHGINHVRNGLRDALSPAQRAIAAVLHPIGDAFAGAAHYGELQEQNERLRTELGAAQRRLQADDEASAQARTTLLLEHLPFLAGISGTLAQVDSASTSNFVATIELDKGRGSGVGPAMPVVAGRGLVGVVTDAGSSSAVVRLVTDTRTRVAADVGGSTATWFVTGNGTGHELTVSLVGGTAGAIRPGALVTTSGLDQGAYPAGIPIATVRTVHAGLKETLSATPIVDLSDLEYVSVLDWLPPA